MKSARNSFFRLITPILTSALWAGVAAPADGQIQAPAAPKSWLLQGNDNVLASDFLGTTTATDLVFKTNNIEQLRLSANGDLWASAASGLLGFGVVQGNLATIKDYTGGDPSLVIDSGGNGGIPTLFLRSGSTGGFGRAEIETADDLYVQLGGGPPAIMGDWPSAYIGLFTDTPTERLHVEGNILCAGMYLGSDLRYKKDVRPLENSLERLMFVQGVSYEYRDGEFPNKDFGLQGRVPGLIAQELESVFPELVRADPQGYKSVNYVGLVPVLIDAVQSQQAIIATQQAALVEQKAMLEDIQKQLRALQSEIKARD